MVSILFLHADLANHYNGLNMTEGIRARVYLQFYGRKISFKTIFYLPKILSQFFDKDVDVPLISPVRIRAARN